MKNKTIAAFVLAYVLLGSVYSVTPTFAENHITIIESTLNDSKERIDEKFAEFVEDGLATPPTALSLYNEGLVKYQEALNFLGLPEPDFVNADTSGRQALTFFGDAYQILKSEEEHVVEPEGYVGDILAIAESITALKDESSRLSDLIDINDLSIISLEELDALITSADTNFTDENYAEALAVIESAEAVLNEILKQIEYKAEEEQAERVSKYVEDLVGDLEDLISSASDAGLDPSVISQFEDLVKLLNNYKSPSDVFDLTSESSDHKEALGDADKKIYKGELEAELLVPGTDDDGGEAEFKQRGMRAELEVEIEGQTAGAVFTVHVNGDEIAETITTDDDGDGKLKLKSKDGDTVPSLIDVDGEIDGDGLIEIKDVDGVVVLSGTFSFEGDDDTPEVEVEDEKVELEAELLVDGTGDDDGKAKFEERSDRIRISVEIEDQADDTEFMVIYINATDDTVTDLGTITTGPANGNDAGFADLNLDSRDGDFVPSNMQVGDMINATSASVELSGTFSLEGEEVTHHEGVEISGSEEAEDAEEDVAKALEEALEEEAKAAEDAAEDAAKALEDEAKAAEDDDGEVSGHEEAKAAEDAAEDAAKALEDEAKAAEDDDGEVSEHKEAKAAEDAAEDAAKALEDEDKAAEDDSNDDDE